MYFSLLDRCADDHGRDFWRDLGAAPLSTCRIRTTPLPIIQPG
jgi:hypothetical protein